MDNEPPVGQVLMLTESGEVRYFSAANPRWTLFRLMQDYLLKGKEYPILAYYPWVPDSPAQRIDNKAHIEAGLTRVKENEDD